MMLSLTACGEEKIEITTDNWQAYLEIKQVFVLEDIEIERSEGTLVLE